MALVAVLLSGCAGFSERVHWDGSPTVELTEAEQAEEAASMRALALAMATVGEGMSQMSGSSSPRISSKCSDLEPLCDVGTHAICVCESDLSLNCGWLCVGGGTW